MEAITRTQEVDEMKQLVKEHQYLVCNQSPPNVWTPDGATGSDGYRSLGPTTVVSSNYIDVAGLAMDHKTIMVKAATCQEGYLPIIFNQAAGDTITIFDIMTSSPMTDTQLLNFVVYQNFASGDTITFHETIYCRMSQYVVDIDTAAFGSMLRVNSSQLGSLEPTASDRIYTYRLIQFAQPITGDRIDVSPARFLVEVDVVEEAEYKYLMRLKRSYELQNEPDVV